MKFHLTLTAAAFVWFQACPSQAGAPPSPEQSIYHPAPPFLDLKRSIYMQERERPLLQIVTSASDSLIPFLIDMHNARPPAANVRQVTDAARSSLRVPPEATGGRSRFVDMMEYCWTSENDNQLEFLVEWADVTTNSRYTDSYVFVRRGGAWYFDKHGHVTPWRWMQTERYFQRACPSHSRMSDR